MSSILPSRFLVPFSPRFNVVRTKVHQHTPFSGYISTSDAEFAPKTPIPHSPIFSQTLMQFYTNPEHMGKHFKVLDMTFGSGGHTCYIIDKFFLSGVKGSITVYANDGDPDAFELARRTVAERCYKMENLVPINSSFTDLEKKLEENDVEKGSLSGILIDTGPSAKQWADKSRGFCYLRNGIIDLRYNQTHNHIPKGYEVLQTIDDASLMRLLKTYGGLKQNAKHVTSAILEARFMYYEFKTIEELYEVMEIAVKHATKSPAHGLADQKMVTEFMEKTITGLRMFVNDELNQLDYAIRYLATKYLKPDLGVLAVIAHNEPEQKVIKKCLTEFDTSGVNLNQDLGAEDIGRLQSSKPWRILYGDPPMPLSTGEQILYPRFKNSVLFAAQRVKMNNS